MTHFAQIDENNIVIKILVIEESEINTGNWGKPSSWIQTSYNTLGGNHSKGNTPLRKNFAGIGYTYDKVRDAFIPPKPYDSWILDENTCIFEAPIKKPTDNKIYNWNENLLNWESSN